MINTRCQYCAYWEFWGDWCVHPDSKRFFKSTPGLTRACELFAPDAGDDNGGKDGKAGSMGKTDRKAGSGTGE